MPADGPALLKRYDRLKSEASTHFTQCERMAPYVCPSRVGILGARTMGDSQVHQVTDSTTLMAAELMAQFIAGQVMNPAQQWGSMALWHPNPSARDAIAEWNEDCRDRMMQAYASSAFYGEGPETLTDWGGFGTGCLVLEEAPPPQNSRKAGFRGVRAEAKKTGRFVIADGPDGLVDTLFDESILSATAIRRRWPQATLPPKIQAALDKGKPDDPFTIIHAIVPRDRTDQQYGAAATSMPWASCWIEKDSKQVIHEGGYRVFPAAVPRFHKTPGEVFGRGRGQIAFPDTWTLNTAKEMGLEDHALKLRPPVLLSHQAVFGTLRLVPSGPTVVNTHGKAIGDVIKPWQTGSHPEVTNIKEEELRKSIRQIFYVDHILSLMEVSKSEMTAFEYRKKLQLLYDMLAPVYGRLMREFLRQTWDITWNLMFWAGAFAPPPPEVFETDGEIDVTFENPIALSQRAGDVEAIGMAVTDLAPLAQVFPDIWDGFDPDKTRQRVFAARGVPASVARNDEEINAVRAARQQQQEGEAMLEGAGQAAEAAGKAAPMVTAMQPQGTA